MQIEHGGNLRAASEKQFFIPPLYVIVRQTGDVGIIRSSKNQNN
jgi:hypothetical protein